MTEIARRDKIKYNKACMAFLPEIAMTVENRAIAAAMINSVSIIYISLLW
jgi:hypothetical protein